ncbi:hypothetical protein VTK56DRAFT_6120 [Thermocarpiscus australiensis]
MITIKTQAECMTNLVPAALVPAEKHFVAFLDASSNPALFSLSNAGQLNLILDHTGIPTVVDFGQKIGIDNDHAVVAFDARQTSDGKISVAVATDQGGGNYGLCLVSSISPADLEQDKLPDSAMLRNSQPLPIIYEVYMSDFTENSLPMVFLAFHPPESLSEESQLGFVNAVPDPSTGNLSLEVDRSWKLATNPEAILAVAFGTCRVGSGAFVLYKSSAGVKLQFRTFKGNQFQVEPVCPSGATCLATYIDPATSHSVLLVGGDQVTQFTSQQYVSPTSAGTTVIDSSATPGLKGLHASVCRQTVSVWFTTKTDSAYCYTADIASITSGLLVPILAEGRGGKLSGLLEVVSPEDNAVVKTLLSADHKGNVTLLQQAPDTRIWRKRPFYASSRTNNVALHGHAVRFQAIPEDLNEDQQKAVGFCKLRLVSTGYLRAVVNGQIAAITADGDWYQTGFDGSLTVFSESRDVPSTLVRVAGFKSHAGVEMPISVDGSSDPAEKLVSKLRDIKTGQDLLNAKTQTGDYLVPQGSISTADAGKAVDALHTLMDHLDEKKAAMALDVQKSGVIRAQRDVFGILDDVWEAFNYVEEKVEEAADWVVQRVDDAIRLSVTLFGEVYEFVTKTIDSVKKAISWVLAKVKIGIKKIIDFAGFLFNWVDILQTSDNFAALFNAGLAFCQDKLASLNRDTKAWIETLREVVTDKSWVGAAHVTDQEVKDDVPKDPRAEARHSPPFNFSSYQLYYGGALSGATVPDAPGGDFTDLGSLFKKEFDRLGTYMSHLSGDLMDLLCSTRDSDKIIAAIGDETIGLGLGMLEDVVDAVLGALSKVLSLLDTLGNAEIEVPIFTALWKRITKGRPLTLLNFFSLVLAIPATILYKLVFGAKPPTLKDRLTGETLALYVGGEPIPNDAQLTQDLRGFAPAADIVVTHLLAEIGLAFSVMDDLRSAGGVLAGTELAAPGLNYRVQGPTKAGAGMELINLPGPLQKLKDIFDGGLLDFWTVITNLPISQEGDSDLLRRLRWLAWGIDAFVRVVKFFTGKIGLGEVEAKEATVVIGFAATFVDLFLQFGISSEEYLQDGKPKKSFLVLLYKWLDIALRLGGNSAEAVETFAKDPETKGSAIIVRQGLTYGRTVFKALWYLFDKYHLPS